MMKKILYFFLAIGLVSFYACDDIMDPETGEGNLTEDQVIYDYNNARQTLYALYSFLPNGFNEIDSDSDANNTNGALLASASDEAEFTLQSATVQRFNNGSWNAVSNPDPAWRNNYKGIYNVNLFLQKVDSIKFPALEKDTAFKAQEELRQNRKEIEMWKFEARVLRAFYYSELVKRYGGVPIVTEKDRLSLTSNFAGIERKSLAESVQFILAECDSAAAVLPEIYEIWDEPEPGKGKYKADDAVVGKATKGLALAIKSRILMFAASDLWNDPSWAGASEEVNKYISLPQPGEPGGKTRDERWREAAQAAYDVMKLKKSGYGLQGDADQTKGYVLLFRPNNYEKAKKEIIFATRFGSSNGFEKTNYPVGFNGGNSGNTPLGNMVDQYEYNDPATGLAVPFDWDKHGGLADPYAGRDPRLAQSIIVNNSTFAGGGDERTVELWAGGRDGSGVANASRTGYYIRKYVDPNLDLLKDHRSNHAWILIRYAEILLNYAEATNEFGGTTGKVPEAAASETSRATLQLIRTRAGIMLPRETDRDKMRIMIRRERQVELAFEGHRPWDARRWMQKSASGNSVLGEPAMGVKITKNADDTFTYTPYEVEKRKWEDKMYFYPIPQTDLQVAGWVQNPFW